MLFQVHASKDTFELNPGLKAIPEFERLTERQMTYVILATDYKSPFKKLSLEERKTKAALIAGYKLDATGKRLDTNGRNLIQGKVGNIEAAIKVYRELQKDEDYETLLSLNSLISQIRAFNLLPDKSADDLKKAVEMNLGKLDKLLETKRKIEELIDVREEEEAVLNEAPVVQMTIDEQNLPVLSQLNAGMI